MASYWGAFVETDTIEVKNLPKVNKKTRIFAIGSCFAQEIQAAFKEKGFNVLPRTRKLFTPSSLWQETAMAYGEFKRNLDDIWHTEWGYLDSYRRKIMDKDYKELLRIIGCWDAEIKNSFLTADVIIITLGITEGWQLPSGSWACVYNERELLTNNKPSLHILNFNECLYYVNDIIRLVQQYNPKAHLVFTVSPVALNDTFSSKDAVIANMDSKSTLRCVMAHCNLGSKVAYYPIYERVILGGSTSCVDRDKRHIRPEVVSKMIDYFLKDTR